MSFAKEINDFLTAFQAGDEIALKARQTAMDEAMTNARIRQAYASTALYQAHVQQLLNQQGQKNAFATGAQLPDQRAAQAAKGAMPDGSQSSSTQPDASQPDVTQAGNTDKNIGNYDTNQDMGYMVNKYGLSPILAAGMIGNTAVESSMISNNKNASNHYGLYQVDPDDKLPRLQQYANTQSNRDISNNDVQHEFVIQDLQKNYPQLWQQMQAAKTPGEVAQLFANGYERPDQAGLRMDERVHAANVAYNNFVPTPTIPSTPVASSPALPVPNSQVAAQDTSSGGL